MFKTKFGLDVHGYIPTHCEYGFSTWVTAMMPINKIASLLIIDNLEKGTGPMRKPDGNFLQSCLQTPWTWITCHIEFQAERLHIRKTPTFEWSSHWLHGPLCSVIDASRRAIPSLTVAEPIAPTPATMAPPTAPHGPVARAPPAAPNTVAWPTLFRNAPCTLESALSRPRSLAARMLSWGWLWARSKARMPTVLLPPPLGPSARLGAVPVDDPQPPPPLLPRPPPPLSPKGDRWMSDGSRWFIHLVSWPLTGIKSRALGSRTNVEYPARHGREPGLKARCHGRGPRIARRPTGLGHRSGMVLQVKRSALLACMSEFPPR